LKVLPWNGNNDLSFVLLLTYTCHYQKSKIYFYIQGKGSVNVSEFNKFEFSGHILINLTFTGPCTVIIF